MDDCSSAPTSLRGSSQVTKQMIPKIYHLTKGAKEKEGGLLVDQPVPEKTIKIGKHKFAEAIKAYQLVEQA